MHKYFLIPSLLFIILATVSCREEVSNLPSPEVDDSLTTSVIMPPKMDSISVEKSWSDYMTPGKMHQQMATEVGTWEEKLTFWTGPFDTKPTTAIISSSTDMILNGLFQETIHKGKMMNREFEGKSTLAYDNVAKIYISTWMDNTGSSILIMKGNYDNVSKKTKLEGQTMDPVYKKMKTVREEISVIDENQQKIEMFDMTAEGKPYRSMSIIRTRQR